jgi:hypothetical protein
MKMHSAVKTAMRETKHRRKQRRPFPYARLAKMWAAGKSIATIARALGRIDKHNPKDPYHSLRNFMYQLRKHAYRDENGALLKLPYHVGTSTRKAAQRAGLRAWA